MKSYIKLMRTHHYIKNLLIFLPLVFGRQLLNTGLLCKALYGFLAYCMLSSVVYIVNDIHDVEQDRLHSTKRLRPIASGAVSVNGAWVLTSVLFIFSLVLNYLACGTAYSAWAFILAYFVLNMGYSLGLKHIPIIDIALLASGFLLRVLYGSAVTDIEISKWLYLTVISMSFYLGLGKRRNELLVQTENSRKVLKFYNHDFLDKNMYMCLALTIAFYSLWSVDPITLQRVSNQNLVWTVPLVILIAMRYSLIIEGDSDGDPVDVLLGDKLLLALTGVFAVVAVWMIYF